MIAEYPKPTHMEAILVMDSRKTSHAIRSQSFSGAWSQLYKAGNFYLDLSLKPQEGGALLQGHIVAEPGHNPNGLVFVRTDKANQSIAISPTGSFRLALQEPGEYGLEIVLQDQVVRVGKLEI